MRIGFYAPMKAPGHLVPSGDREMARLLIAALRRSGHGVDLISSMRSFLARPDAAGADAIAAAASREVDRLAAAWSSGAGRPDLVFAYHLHYKAPDFIGLPLARRFGLPYVTAEASYARKRETGPWASRQVSVADAVRSAEVNLCLTDNDRAGLAEIVGSEKLMDLPPFIDARVFAPRPDRATRKRCELVTVAMMRPGDKLRSYQFLAEALVGIVDLDWRLTVMGEGPAREDVEASLSVLPPSKVRLLGLCSVDTIASELQAADLFVWPGFNEAFGLCYLEAAASGLPCVAVQGAGTPSVIRDGVTGLLTPPDPQRYAAAVARLLSDRTTLAAFGQAARHFIVCERDIPGAALRLDEAILRACRLSAAELAHG